MSYGATIHILLSRYGNIRALKFNKEHVMKMQSPVIPNFYPIPGMDKLFSTGAHSKWEFVFGPNYGI